MHQSIYIYPFLFLIILYQFIDITTIIITLFYALFGLYIIYFDQKSVAIHPPPIEVSIKQYLSMWGTSC